MNSNVNKFNNKSGFYDKYRPKYSEELIDFIIASTNSKDNTIADIGCGTGILTKQLTERNCNVIGIEPNKEMYEKAKKNLVGIEVLNTTAEDTTLANNSIDIITVAQALHWFNLEEFKKEVKRILRDNGSVAIMYNNYYDDKDIIKEFKEIHKKYCNNYNNQNRNLKELFDILFGDDYILKTFPNNQKYTYDEFMGYTFSLSYSLKEDDVNYSEYVDELKKIFDKYSINGIIELPMNSKLAFGQID